MDNQSFEGSKTRLQVEFDAVVTAEDAGYYKPSLRNFEHMMERLGAGLGGTAFGKQEHPARRRKPVPRPQACQRVRARLLLDPPPAPGPGFRGDHAPGRHAEDRLQTHQHGRARPGPPRAVARMSAVAGDLRVQAGFDDFKKLDIRVGRIVEVATFPRARNPSCEIAVNLGPLGGRWSNT